MTLNRTCTQCGELIPDGLDACPECGSGKSKQEAASIFFILALLLASFLMLGTSIVNVNTAPSVAAAPKPPTDLNVAAYNAAKGYIQERFPGPKAFAQLPEASIEQTNDATFIVTLACEDLSKPNAPVRNFFRVEMRHHSGKWELVQIAQ